MIRLSGERRRWLEKLHCYLGGCLEREPLVGSRKEALKRALAADFARLLGTLDEGSLRVLAAVLFDVGMGGRPGGEDWTAEQRARFRERYKGIIEPGPPGNP